MENYKEIENNYKVLVRIYLNTYEPFIFYLTKMCS